MALQQGHEKVVSVLLEYDSRGTSRVQLTALHIAAKKDDVKAAALLLQNERAQFINDDSSQVRAAPPVDALRHWTIDRHQGLKRWKMK